MLNIDKRSATIGKSFNGRTQNHGDEQVPALDLQLEGIVLSEAELNALLRDPHADQALFLPPGGSSTLAVPRFPGIEPLRLREKVKGAKVTIWLPEKGAPIVLDACNLAKIDLEPQEGGTTLLSCQVQATGPTDKSVARLFEQLGHAVAVEIVEAQADVQDIAA